MTSARGPSSRVPPRLVRRRRPRPATRHEPAVGWEALSAAVAVLAARRDAAPDLRDSIVRAEPPERVILGLEIVARAALSAPVPEDNGARALEALGVLAAKKGAEQL